MELLPCPFCGFPAATRHDFIDKLTPHYVGCANVWCRVDASASAKTQAAAIAAWNTRPAASTKEGEQAAGQVEGGEGGVRVWECKSGCCEWKETPLGKFIRHKVRSGWGPWIEWESRADRPHWMTLKLRELHDPEKDAAMKEGA